MIAHVRNVFFFKSVKFLTQALYNQFYVPIYVLFKV